MAVYSVKQVLFLFSFLFINSGSSKFHFSSYSKKEPGPIPRLEYLRRDPPKKSDHSENSWFDIEKSGIVFDQADNVPEDFFADTFEDLRDTVTSIADRPIGLRGSFLRLKHWKEAATLAQKAHLPEKSAQPHSSSTSTDRFHQGISSFELYPESSVVDSVLRDLATQKITHIEEITSGTQFKLLVTYENGAKALLKPMRYPRDHYASLDHYQFDDFERHNAEIAAFHLDRVLGFRRVPPVAGRLVNITSELYPLAALKLLRTFFISPAGNICFHGTCYIYCDTAHAFCGRPDMIEVSVTMYLPPDTVAPRSSWTNPWKLSYDKRRKADWEMDRNYCDGIRKRSRRHSERRLNDLIDLGIFDFLIGNHDRHNYATFEVFNSRQASFVLYDHGRAFGYPVPDDASLLAPLSQCCQIRMSTLQSFLRFHRGSVHLSDAIDESMRQDSVYPILLKPHLHALDRRVYIILRTVRQCLEDKDDPTTVIVNDGF